MPTPNELTPLLAYPNETLSREYKSWLDISGKAGKATLAKAAIALANHGGGIIVLGMRENGADGSALGSQKRPEEIGRYSLDDINAAINRFADPELHCELSFANHPETEIEHAFVSVPSGETVPVMSKRGHDDVIAARRCYIRKPGPRSQEPHNAEEWRTLLVRCVRDGRENMLDAIREIIQGHAGTAPSEEARNRLTDFVTDAQKKWQELIEPLPEQDVARMPQGHYELAFEILDVPVAPNLVELLRRLDEAGQIRHTGWGPFVNLHRKHFEPYSFEGLIETWLGTLKEGRLLRTPAYCDFWRAHPDGRMFLQRGYIEDESKHVQPGTCIDITLPIRRVGEAMLHVARLARTFGDNPTIVVRCHYTGIQNRFLTSINHRRLMSDNHVCNDRDATIETQATATEIDDNLAEILHPMLLPFYERFSFFELSMQVVVEEIERLRQKRS